LRAGAKQTAKRVRERSRRCCIIWQADIHQVRPPVVTFSAGTCLQKLLRAAPRARSLRQPNLPRRRRRAVCPAAA